MGFFQIPWLPELALSTGHGYVIGQIFERVAMDRRYLPNDIVDVYRQQACEPGAPTAMINYYRAAFRGGGAWRQGRLGYPRIEIPTLVIWGLQDQALVAQNLDGLSEYVTDLTVVTMADAGHFVHEDKPHAVTGHLLAWLRDRLAS
jgi:pimeloyl-ACP methyl ester carboxylesterase